MGQQQLGCCQQQQLLLHPVQQPVAGCCWWLGAPALRCARGSVAGALVAAGFAETCVPLMLPDHCSVVVVVLTEAACGVLGAVCAACPLQEPIR